MIVIIDIFIISLPHKIFYTELNSPLLFLNERLNLSIGFFLGGIQLVYLKIIKWDSIYQIWYTDTQIVKMNYRLYLEQ